MTKLLFEQHEILLIKLKSLIANGQAMLSVFQGRPLIFFLRGVIVLRIQNLICKEGPHKLIKCHLCILLLLLLLFYYIH